MKKLWKQWRFAAAGIGRCAVNSLLQLQPPFWRLLLLTYSDLMNTSHTIWPIESHPRTYVRTFTSLTNKSIVGF